MSGYSFTGWVRPDGRLHLLSLPSGGEPLDELVRRSTGDLYVTAPESDDERLGRYQQLGFVPVRRERLYVIPVADAHVAVAGSATPDGVVLVIADAVDEDRLRLLDDELRQDVPGTDGWRWTPEDFREETYNPHFDPALYVVAVDRSTGAYVGLARVWNRPARPRLGMIGVVRSRRRRGLARALLAPVFAELQARGVPGVVTEADVTNVASTSLLESLGARPTGVSVELVRRAVETPS